jgi:virginiamycin B lyase
MGPLSLSHSLRIQQAIRTARLSRNQTNFRARRALALEALENRLTPSTFPPAIAANIVTGLYRQMLQRDPDSGGLATFSAQLEAGAALSAIVDSIWNSPEFHSREVTNYYQVYLGRNPDAVGLNSWVQSMVAGELESSVVNAFLTSSEFLTQHAGNADFVTALYNDLLARTPDSTGLNFWVTQLDGGTPRSAVVDDFLSATEFHTDRLTSLYPAILGRPADSAGLSFWQQYRAQPNITIRNVESAFITSDENLTNLESLSGITLASPLVTEYQLTYTSGGPSTHEIEGDPTVPDRFWISGQLHDELVRFDAKTGQPTYFQMPKGSGPHGIAFDSADRLWVSLEFFGEVVQVDPQSGAILQTIDVELNNVTGAAGPINTFPHDIAIGGDGQTIWFVGKSTGTLGKINPDGTVNHYQLLTVASTPIYISLGPDGNMWGTELAGNKIFRVTPEGVISEFAIPTFNSRPIAIIPAPDGQPFMWFSEENGHAVARIDMSGNITEFPVPRTQSNMLMAGLGFDAQGNLYAESYVNQNDKIPPGPDFIVRLNSSILTAQAGDLSTVLLTRYQVPSTATVFHRIILGSDGNMYFTELAQDKVGRLIVTGKSDTPQGYSFNLGI